MQEQSNISNRNLPSLVNTNIFQLIVAGETRKVKRFWEFLETAPEYSLSNVSQKLSVDVQTQDEEEVCFTLTNVKVMDTGKGVIYMKGKLE